MLFILFFVSEYVEHYYYTDKRTIMNSTNYYTVYTPPRTALESI